MPPSTATPLRFCLSSEELRPQNLQRSDSCRIAAFPPRMSPETIEKRTRTSAFGAIYTNPDPADHGVGILRFFLAQISFHT